MKTATVTVNVPKLRGHVRLRRALLCAALVTSGLGVSCQASNGVETGGETHFLKSCSPVENDCGGGGLSCVCGVCTVRCDDDAACAMFPEATCVEPDAEQRCGEPKPVRRCDTTCRSDDDCAAVSPFHVCTNGECRTESPTPIVEPSAPSAASATSDAGQVSSSAPADAAATESSAVPQPDAAQPNSCVQSDVNPNDLLLIGDSFFAATHQVTAYLEGLARGAGVLAEGERYRDGSRMVVNGLAGGGIEQQYLTALDDGPVQVVIMNGGGADAFISTCEVLDDTCTELLDAVSAAEALLAQMAANGVTNVVYAFYPDSENDDVRGRVDFLRPRIESVCANAPLTCHWLDLRVTFEGFMDTYIAADGSLPTSAGSEATAKAIWAVMRDHCIAQ